LKKKWDEAKGQCLDYARQLQAMKARAKVPQPGHQLEFDLSLKNPSEKLFSFPMTKAKEEAPVEKRRVEPEDRLEAFKKMKGLHSSYDIFTRYDLELTVTAIPYRIETLRDFETNKSVRASTRKDGPDGFHFTWRAVSNLIKMHVGFAIPTNRIQAMVGQKEFSSSQILRVLQYVAKELVIIYLGFSELLADVGLLFGDDTKTKVLIPCATCDGEDPICDPIDDQLGWIQPRADGKGDKKALNVSLIVGRTEDDPRSTIRFFRTHAGSVGNLLTQLLELRRPGQGPVIFQGDLSTTNLPSPEMRKVVELILAGCAAHARRPLWRHRADDESFCYFMLRGFLSLSRVEKRIDALGRTRKNVLKIRGKYGQWIWQAMRNRCIAATTGVAPSPGTYPAGITPHVWPPGSDLYRAAMYIINHFKELTLYLEVPELSPTNNSQERALRVEKCMLSSSMFRKTKRGRVTLDILRTINATCTAAGVDLEDYLRFVFEHIDALQDHPLDFTPFAFALSRDQKLKELEAKTEAPVSEATMSAQ
jgi:hypothetical protein